MKTKIAAIMLALAMLVTACAGCSNPDSKDNDKSSGDTTATPYADYDLSEYVTVGQYKGLSVTSSEFTFTDEDLQEQIQLVLSGNAETVEVTDRPVQSGDVVNIDYTGYMDGEAFENGADTGYDLTIGSGSFIPGFEDALIGFESGETRTIDVTFPDPYESNTDFSGKAAQFEVTVNSISTSVIPEYNEEFLTKYYDEYKTLAEFEAAVKLAAEENFNYNNEMDIIDDAWAQVMANSSTIKYPEAEYQKYYDESFEYYENMTQQYYELPLEEFLVNHEGTTIDQFKEEVKGEVEAYLDEQMVFYYIIKQEGLEMTEEQYQESLAQYMSDFGATEEQLISYYGEEYLRNTIQWEIVLHFIVENAVVTTETAAG